MSNMKKCLIYLEKGLEQQSTDLLEVVRQMYEGEAVEVCGVAVNHSFQESMGFFHTILSVQHQEILDYDTVAIGDLLVGLLKTMDFHSILIPASPFGRMLAPRMAMALHVGLVADVTRISHKHGCLEMIRPAFSGRLLAGIVSKGKGPIMMSIRQGVFTYEGPRDRTSQVVAYEPDEVTSGGIRILDTRLKPASYDIRESDVLISGGGGMLRNFSKLDALAEALEGQVSASRRVVDQGIAPRSIQVGQSGKTVSPKLYMALGIFGSIQHVEGLKNVENIISVNTNRHAPICSLSDIVVEGDAVAFVDALVTKINKNKTT